MKKIYFIINPQAGNGYCKKVWVKVERELLSQNIPYMAFFSEHRGHARDIATKVAKNADGEKVVIIAVGGDGTLNEVISGAVNYENISLGFIPGGSGNDFTRGFRVPKLPMDALQVLLRQAKRNPLLVDVGVMSGGQSQSNYFINSMGAGFDALISLEANQTQLKKILNRLYMGSLIYPLLILKNLFRYNCTDVQIKIDGRSLLFERTWFVTVSNQPYYGGGMKISPEASPVDGMLDITVVHKLSKIKLLLVFISVFWGGHTAFKEVRTFKGRSITINSSSPIHTHADGEYNGSTPVHIEVSKSSLPILIRGLEQGEEEAKEWKSNECD